MVRPELSFWPKQKQKQSKLTERKNACTLVPTVFLRHRKTEFKLPVSFSVFPRPRKIELELPF